MDKIVFNGEHVHLAQAGLDSSPWSDFLTTNPKIEDKFRGGKASPIFLDLLIADTEFAPVHDNPEKNGHKYTLSRESLQKAIADNAFDNLPVHLHKLDQATHAKGERRTVGATHGAVMLEDDRGPYVQVLASVWDSEIPTEFQDIKRNQAKIGASAEFGVRDFIADGDVTRINSFMPTGMLLLEKDKAALKETALYCSDSEAGGEPATEQNTENKPTKTATKTKPKKGGRKMSVFCETCTPLVETHVEKAVAQAKDEFSLQLAEYSKMKGEHDKLELAAADANKRAEEAENKLKEQKEAYEKRELGLLELAAAESAKAEFESRKSQYPEDKHDEIKRILFRLKVDQHTPEDALNLADWKITANPDKETGDPLSLAGATSQGDKPKYSDAQLDAMLKVTNLYGYPTKGGS